MTRVGVGHSARRRSGEAADEAVRAALASLGGRTPDVLLVFANLGYDQTSLLSAILEVAGRDTPICGCSSEGIIYRDGCNEQVCAVNVMAIASDRIAFDAFNVAGLSPDPRACGAAIARRIRELGPARARAAFVFPDGLSGGVTEMLRSLDAALPFSLPIAGGAAGATVRRDVDRPQRTHQYLNASVITDSVSVLVAGGPLAVEVAVSHGCTPLGPPRTVTAADGGWLREIDGRPAWDVLRAYADSSASDLPGADLQHLCIGEPLDPALREEHGADYLIRAPVVLGEDRRSLFVPGGLQLGNTIQLARRDPERVAASARQSAQALARRRPGQTPIAVFQFDCAGRGYQLFGENAAGAAVRALQKAFASNPPWIGFHTFGEIAAIGRTPHYLNGTVVLCALYET